MYTRTSMFSIARNGNFILLFVDLSLDCRNITFGYKFHFNKEVNFQNKNSYSAPTTTTTPSQRDEDDDDDEHYGMFLTSFYGFVI